MAIKPVFTRKKHLLFLITKQLYIKTTSINKLLIMV